MFEAGNLLLFKPFFFKNGALPKNKFMVVLGHDAVGNMVLASYPVVTFRQQIADKLAKVELIGRISESYFTALKDCLKNSKMVKNKYKRIL